MWMCPINIIPENRPIYDNSVGPINLLLPFCNSLHPRTRFAHAYIFHRIKTRFLFK